MRLKTIKLAGFKSFVDPTVLNLPSNLIGVVGPNGCGKSNIIDAVRWVMGESSARLLRGESMSDVIFNGSSSRKPVSAANVELIFDNSDGAVGGEYASYAEISVKRQVFREGQSFYYLNGSKCRRRDIVDIFLGTGLGPRSYSIIEQGMISKLVEARPEELRHHLEEAAGISKYRERRRETENRIRHTRENLERLDDLRGELDSQLRRLDRQAKQAERYKALKGDYRQRQAELLILQWAQIETQLEAQSRQRQQVETEREKCIAALRDAEKQIELKRTEQTAANETLSKVQSEVYDIGGQIARIEQAIKHREETRERQKIEQNQAEASWQDMQKHLDLDRVQQEQLNKDIERIEPQLASAREQEQSDEDQAQQADARLREWQQQWDEFSQQSSEVSRDAEVERTRISHLDAKLSEYANRLQQISKEDHSESLKTLQADQASAEAALETGRAEQQTLEDSLTRTRTELESQQDSNTLQREQLNATRQEYQQARGRLSSLEALQQAALGLDDRSRSDWLTSQSLDQLPRLAQKLDVQDGWERAVETALGETVEAIVHPKPATELLELAADSPSRIILVEDRGEVNQDDAQTLLSRVRGPAVLSSLLANILVAEDLQAATALLGGLKPEQSIITRQGEWLGRGWVRIQRADSADAGVIGRERELKTLGKRLAELEKEGETLKTTLETGEQRSRELEQQRDQLQVQVNQQTRKLAEHAAALDGVRSRIGHLNTRSAELARESGDLSTRLDDDTATLRDARARLQARMDSMADFETRREALASERQTLEEQRRQARERASQSRTQAQALAIDLETRKANLSSIEQALTRTAQQLEQLDQRRSDLLKQIETASEPIQKESAALKNLVAERLVVDKRMTEARTQLDAINLAIRELDQQRLKSDQAVQAVRDRLEQLKLDEQRLTVRNETVAEEFARTEFDRETLSEALDDDLTVEQCQQDLESLSTKITRLEPVNLAAIQEFTEQSERKDYLDSQHADLTEALDTLEGAIHKIDKQTRTRFKETFDQVNTGLKQLFPKLFGGGHAYLELVGDDLLTAGVAIFARPPGKRISNIHLMSGGEKALTAVALVFSIFQLNPAPFCLLDEVDAPLDDANVSRFSDMVREMSETVQFLFVSHNKITMEIAHQLSGVTMREAGVSRMVSVDVNEAEKMVAG